MLELRPEHAAKRPQIVVIRSRTVIKLLEQLGVIDFLFKESRIFPFGRLQLEVSLADLELAFLAILRGVVADGAGLSIHYGAVIKRVNQFAGYAHVIARKAETELSFSPRLIVIADGRHSPTSALLGLSRCDRFYSHTGIIAIFRAGPNGLSPLRRWFGDLISKLRYAFHRHASRRGRQLLAGTILQVPGHHYLGLDLASEEEMRLRGALARARYLRGCKDGASLHDLEAAHTDEVRRLVQFWSNYAFEAIRTQPIGSAPHTGEGPSRGSRSTRSPRSRSRW